jgi:hypothetical protein
LLPLGLAGTLVVLWLQFFEGLLDEPHYRLWPYLAVALAGGLLWVLSSHLIWRRGRLGDLTDRLLEGLRKARAARVQRAAACIAGRADARSDRSEPVLLAEALGSTVHRAVTSVVMPDSDLRALEARGVDVHDALSRILAKKPRPLLRSLDLLGQCVGGCVIGVLGMLVLAVPVAALLDAGESPRSGEAAIGYALLAILVGCSLAAPVGVYLGGLACDRRGSFWATLGGGVLLLVLACSLAQLVSKDLGSAALFVGPVLTLIGGLVGFNLTRRLPKVG